MATCRTITEGFQVILNQKDKYRCRNIWMHIYALFRTALNTHNSNSDQTQTLETTGWVWRKHKERSGRVQDTKTLKSSSYKQHQKKLMDTRAGFQSDLFKQSGDEEKLPLLSLHYSKCFTSGLLQLRTKKGCCNYSKRAGSSRDSAGFWQAGVSNLRS